MMSTISSITLCAITAASSQNPSVRVAAPLPAARAPAAPSAAPVVQVTPDVAAPMPEAASEPAPVRLSPAAFKAQAHALRFEQDTASNLTLAESYITSISYGVFTGNAIFNGMANLSEAVSAPLTALPLAAGIVGTYYLSHMKPALHGGVLSAVNIGIWTGALDGLFLTLALTPDNTNGDTARRVTLSTTWAAATAGGAAAGYLAHKYHATTGDLAIIGTTTFWGAVSGLLLDLTSYAHSHDDPGFRLGSTSILLGSLAGTGTGVALASYYDFSRARSWFLDLGGVVGLCTATGILAGADVRSAAGVGGMLLGGEIVGLAAAGLLTHTLDVPEIDLGIAMHLAPAPIAYTSARQAGPAFMPGMALSGSF